MEKERHKQSGIKKRTATIAAKKAAIEQDHYKEAEVVEGGSDNNRGRKHTKSLLKPNDMRNPSPTPDFWVEIPPRAPESQGEAQDERSKKEEE